MASIPNQRNQSPNPAHFTPKLCWDCVQLGKHQIRKLLAAPLAAADPGNCRAGSRNGDSWNNKVGPREIKAGVAEEGRCPGTAESPRIHGRSPELTAPPSQHSQPPRSRLALVTAVMPSVPPLLLSPCPGTGPCIVPSHQDSSAQPQRWETPQGMRIRDHQGGSPRKEHQLGRDSPCRIPMRG